MKEEILSRVIIAYPSGNTTAIVMDQLLETDREALNSKIMKSWIKGHTNEPEIEQCCFITPPKGADSIGRVEMFGGEFCGNATRSAIQLLTKGADYEGKIEVSGVKRPLEFKVVGGVIDLEMPLPDKGDIVRNVDEGTLVQLDGIAHLVVTDQAITETETPRELLAKLLAANTYGLADQPATGVSFYNLETAQADFAVWVNEVNTTFDETACGSGTSAIGIALATQTGRDVDASVIQPSGESINTKAKIDTKTGKVSQSRIAGTVSILYDDQFKLA